MKASFLLLIFALALLPSSIYAQKNALSSRPNPNPTGTIPAGELFIGTWQWSSGNEVFRITLVRNPALNVAGVVSSAVTGQHSYTRNGTVIDQYTAGGTRPYSLLGLPRNNSSIMMGYHEFTTELRGTATLTLVPGNPNQLTWQLEHQEGIFLYPANATPPASYFVTPLTMTLTRQP